jgi:RNA polymerase sigma-70 factor (ECF subfamily)
MQVNSIETDQILLVSARRMNGDALAAIFDLYASALYKYAFRFCENALMADQIVGDAFSKLVESLAIGKGPVDNLRSYLFEITYHLLVDQTRYYQRRISIEAVEPTLPDGYAASTIVENQLLLEAVMKAIQCDLTDYQRHVIMLRYFEGFSMAETGMILGKSVKHIKAAQNRAIVKLRRAMNGPFEAPAGESGSGARP